MLIGIDGTGVADNGIYQHQMRYSFVNQFLSDYTGSNPKYFRGPTLLGAECSEIVQQALISVGRGVRSEDAIHLTGYSRGGAVAIRIAQLMKSKWPSVRIPVMALFDAVSRQPEFDASKIPGNVDVCYHAIRDPSVGSRSYFGNCGIAAEPPCILNLLIFRTSHGGMGGVPFPGADVLLGVDIPTEAYFTNLSASDELRGSDGVHGWMWRQLQSHGLVRAPTLLRPYPPKPISERQGVRR